MTLAERLYWFKRDCGDVTVSIPEVEVQIGTMEFLNNTADYLLTIVVDCQRGLAKLGNPADLEGFDQILYDDHIELHNRAVDLYNDLMDRGVDCEI